MSNFRHVQIDRDNKGKKRGADTYYYEKMAVLKGERVPAAMYFLQSQGHPPDGRREAPAATGRPPLRCNVPSSGWPRRHVVAGGWQGPVALPTTSASPAAASSGLHACCDRVGGSDLSDFIRQDMDLILLRELVHNTRTSNLRFPWCTCRPQSDLKPVPWSSGHPQSGSIALEADGGEENFRIGKVRCIVQ